jgi:hypothetical protein
MRKQAAALGVLLFSCGLNSGNAQPTAPCKTIRADGASFLQLCGSRLRSVALSMPGTERTAVREHTNKFRFSCRVGFCQNEPTISGWFVDRGIWTRSKKDEAAIFDILAGEAGWKLLGSEQQFRNMLKPSCEPVPIIIAGLPGRMVCYNTESATTENPPTIVMVAADDSVGVMLLFQSPDAMNITATSLAALKTFSLERGEGDATLERWLHP